MSLEISCVNATMSQTCTCSKGKESLFPTYNTLIFFLTYFFLCISSKLPLKSLIKILYLRKKLNILWCSAIYKDSIYNHPWVVHILQAYSWGHLEHKCPINHKSVEQCCWIKWVVTLIELSAIAVSWHQTNHSVLSLQSQLVWLCFVALRC